VVDDVACVDSSGDSESDWLAKVDEIMNSSYRSAVNVEGQDIMGGEEQIGINLSKRLSEREQFRKGVFGIVMMDYPREIRWEIQKFFICRAAEEGKPGIDI
jgi:hypothetical protein